MACADPEVGGQGNRTHPPPLKNHKTIWFSSNTGPDPRHSMFKYTCKPPVAMYESKRMFLKAVFGDTQPIARYTQLYV